MFCCREEHLFHCHCLVTEFRSDDLGIGTYIQRVRAELQVLAINDRHTGHGQPVRHVEVLQEGT